MTAGRDLPSALERVRALAKERRPRLAVILGSGLGVAADDIAGRLAIGFDELPGFPQAGVAGHAGELVFGRIGGVEAVFLKGRAHYYEHGRADAMKQPIRLLKALGVEMLFLTNAAGSLHADMPPGSLMAISDHINFVGTSPLFGETGADRFVDMVDAYDPRLRERLAGAAAGLDCPLHHGVYVWFCGPQFETPVEIRAARALGGDAVGMSTVPETILARHAGLKVVAMSLITNLAAGMSAETLSHAQTLRVAAEGSDRAVALIHRFIAEVAS